MNANEKMWFRRLFENLNKACEDAYWLSREGEGAPDSELCHSGNKGDEANQHETGTFTDERDGQIYRTVRMPDGKIWMAQNLNYKTPDGSWCYGDDEANGAKYGRLYTWDAAKAACPAGWHLPTREEWATLVEAVGGDEGAGKKLKSKSGWRDDGNGADDYGFSALPGGSRIYDGSFNYAANIGFWWTATEYGSGYAYYRSLYYYNGYVCENYNVKEYGFSVRCLKDGGNE